jgi:hypothetical protein
MNCLRVSARVIGRPLDPGPSQFRILDFIFFLVEIGVNSQIPGAKHIRLLMSSNSVKAHTPALDYVGVHIVIEWIWLQTSTPVIIGVDVDVELFREI